MKYLTFIIAPALVILSITILIYPSIPQLHTPALDKLLTEKSVPAFFSAIAIAFTFLTILIQYFRSNEDKNHHTRLERNNFTLELIREWDSLKSNTEKSLYVDRVIFLSESFQEAINTELIKNYIRGDPLDSEFSIINDYSYEHHTLEQKIRDHEVDPVEAGHLERKLNKRLEFLTS
ncbi:MAG: hypothetical protein R3F02_03720 [Thiolinea sp.]